MPGSQVGQRADGTRSQVPLRPASHPNRAECQAPLVAAIYVIECECGTFYIGRSKTPYRRYREHERGRGAIWTQMYKPLHFRILRHEANKYDEDNFTLEYMSKYGIEYVRGGAWSNPYLSDRVKEEIRHRINSANGNCFRCGSKRHLAARCSLKPNEKITTLDDFIRPPDRTHRIRPPIESENIQNTQRSKVVESIE